MLDLTKIPLKASPNWNYRRGSNKKISHIIIHAMQGFYAGTQATFMKPGGYSAHYLVSKKGEILCMVPPEKAGKHVANFNGPSLGIELEDGSFKMVNGKKQLLHCQNHSNWCTDEEYKAAASLTAALMKKYEIPLANVIGHNDPKLRALGNTHTDPDRFFNWTYFRKLIQEELDRG